MPSEEIAEGKTNTIFVSLRNMKPSFSLFFAAKIEMGPYFVTSQAVPSAPVVTCKSRLS